MCVLTCACDSMPLFKGPVRVLDRVLTSLEKLMCNITFPISSNFSVVSTLLWKIEILCFGKWSLSSLFFYCVCMWKSFPALFYIICGSASECCFTPVILLLFKLDSHHNDELHWPTLFPALNLMESGLMDHIDLLSNLHLQRWVGWWVSKCFNIHCPSSLPNHMGFLLCQKIYKDLVYFK